MISSGEKRSGKDLEPTRVTLSLFGTRLIRTNARILKPDMKLMKFLLPVLAAAILFPVSIHAKSGKSVRSAEQWSQEYFSGPFHATFTADASAFKYSDSDTYFIFYRDGLARIFHSSVYPVYECYAYQTDGNSVTLRGICTIKQDAVNFRKLEAVPDDIRLQFTGYGKNATLKGQDKGGVSYSLENMTEGHINRMYNGADLNDMIASIDASRKWDTENLWLVDSGYGTPAVTATYEGHALTSFPDGAIISGIPDPEDPRYILVDYIKGQKLYVDTHDLRKIGSERQFDEILYADASACLPYYKWTGSFEEKIRETDSSGYLNGWKAGRQMATVFLPLLLVLAILLILNKIFSEPAWPDILYYVTSSVLMLTTIFEIWYAISLKTDMLWFIFDPLTFVHGFAAAIGSLIFICIQLDLILITQKNLLEFNDTYSRCPSWLEWLIAVPAMMAGIPLVLFGNALAGIGGCSLLVIAALPRLIGYISHSSHETPILPFMLLCYPVKFILFIPLFILIILKETDKYKVTAVREEEDEEEHKTVTDVYGNSINLHKTPGGGYMGDDGQPFIKSGESFFPGGISRKDGPYR